MLTARDIFHADQPTEGVRIAGPLGDFSVLCTARTGTFPVGLPGLPNTGGGAAAASPVLALAVVASAGGLAGVLFLARQRIDGGTD